MENLYERSRWAFLQGVCLPPISNSASCSVTSSEPVFVESQPTQLLENILGVGNDGGSSSGIEPAHYPHEHEQTTRTVEEPNITKDSFGSSSSSVRQPVTRYHLHGLAATQTQHDECADNEGSQKENNPTSAEIQASSGTNFQACSPRLSSSKVPPTVPHINLIGQPFGNKGSVAMTTTHPLYPPNEHTPPLNKRASKAVSFQSPRPNIGSASPVKVLQPSRTMPGRPTHYYRRSPSQDSFGGPVSQDPEKVFFESAKQFEVPLSELGLPSSEGASESPEAEPVEEEPSFLELVAVAYEREKRMRSAESYDTPDYGKVLVASTPSNSGSSQSQGNESLYNRQSNSVYNECTNNLVETQPSTQLFEDSSEPSSSYERLLAGEPSNEPTQIELEPTQFDDSGTNDRDELPTPVPRSSAPSTAARSLLSLIEPHKRARYAKYLNVAPREEQLNAEALNRGELISDTQPSNVTNNGIAIPGYSEADPPRGIDHLRRNIPVTHPRSPPRSDAMDVVPDSEPPRAELRPTTPRRPTSPLTDVPGTSGRRMRNSGYPPSNVALESMDVDKGTKDDLSDGDDIPLAATMALKTVGKGKGKMAAPRTNTGHNPRRTGVNGQSSDTGVVPSSAPDQDALKTTDAAPPDSERPVRARSKGTGSKPTSTVSDRKTRATSATSDVSTKRQRISSDTEEDDELRLKARELAGIPKAMREEEEETELADEDYMDVDGPEDDMEPGPSTRKRKRGPKRKGVKTVSRASVKPNIRSTPTLTSRPNKRFRSVASSSRAFIEPATTVFALWKQDSYYYSGIVYSHSASTKYLVKFDDGTDDIVDISKMRRCEPMAGDEVILVEDARRATVKQFQDDSSVALVEVDDGEELEELEVNVQDIRITGRTISRQWQNRMLEPETIVPVVKPRSLKSTPSPSKGSLLSNPSTKGGRSKVLNRTGLVITMTPHKDNWEKEKERVVLAIKSNGGTVIEDWPQIISMEGRHSNGGKRWVGVSDEFRWIGSDNLQQVFLLADDANQKSKFLMALALGVPCLSFNWLFDTVEKVSKCTDCSIVFVDIPSQGVKDWQPYLLPAGSSEKLLTRVSQMVDVEWGTCTEHLSDIMSNPVASKLFTKKSILCYGTEFIPLPRKKVMLPSLSAT